MTGAQVLFFALAAIAVVSALAVITRRNPIVAAVWLILAFLAVAANYVLLTATFLGVIQILVYAGAVMVLFIFVIMVLDVDATGQLTHRRPSRVRKLAYYGIGTLAIGFVGWVFVGTLARQYADPGAALSAGFGTAEAVGREIFYRYLFPFEAISLLLLAAVIGAVVVARSRKEREEAARDLDPAARHAAGLSLPDEGEAVLRGPSPDRNFGEPSATGHHGGT